MEARPALAVVALILVLLTTGCVLPSGGSDAPDGSTDPIGDEQLPGTLEERWLGEANSSVSGNHHAVAAGRIDGEPGVYVPIGGRNGQRGCGLYALDGDGDVRWTHRVPPENCTIHAVADPVLADLDDDGSREVLATTTERAVFALDARSGDVEYRQNLTAYGYTHPILADVTGNGVPELVVVDVDGTLFVLRQDGSVVWQRSLDAYAWVHPQVGDFDGDGGNEVLVALGDGRAVAFSDTGQREWQRDDLGSVTWIASRHGHHGGGESQTHDGDAGGEHHENESGSDGHHHDGGDGHHHDGDEQGAANAPDVVLASTDGSVAALNAATGDVAWSRDFGELAAVRAYGDGDADGQPEVYTTAVDGKLRALNATDGSTEWTTTLTTGDVQMTPPPTLGDLDGDGAPELAAVTNDGRVLVVAPDGGRVLAAYERDASVYTHVTLADTDADGAQEIYAMYGDGRVAALEYRPS